MKNERKVLLHFFFLPARESRRKNITELLSLKCSCKYKQFCKRQLFKSFTPGHGVRSRDDDSESDSDDEDMETSSEEENENEQG